MEGPRHRRARPADRRRRRSRRRATARCRSTPSRRRRCAASRVKKPIKTGIRVIDFFTPLCAGQRIGIFAGSGVGKSSLLAMLARAPDFDTVVIALVGERGREVREFLDDTLAANRASAVAVVSTGDESPMMRRLAPQDRDDDRRIFSRPRRFGAADRRFGDALRPCGARRRAGRGRARRRARLCAERVQRAAPAARARRAPASRAAARSPASFRCWSTATITTIPSPTAFAARSTAISCSIARSPTRAAIPPSISCPRSRASTRPNWTPEQRKLVAKLRSLVSRYEETRDLRLMGGYHARRRSAARSGGQVGAAHLRGDDPGLSSPACQDPFIELAAALRNDGKSDDPAEQAAA